MKYRTFSILLAASLISSAHAAVIIGTDFTGRTFSGNTVTVTDYTLDGVTSPGALTFNGPSNFFTSSDATDKAIPIRNAPNWDVLIPVNVAGADIELDNISITFEAFNNGGDSKTGISGGFSPNYQPTARLLDSSQTLIDQQTLDAWADNGNNLVAGWTGVFNFVNDDTLLANTDYFIEIDMTGSGGNNVGINSLALNGTITAIPEPSSFALLGLGALAALCRRSRR